jgi:hypothetical protein
MQALRSVRAVTANSISTLQQHGPHLSDKSRVLSTFKCRFQAEVQDVQDAQHEQHRSHLFKCLTMKTTRQPIPAPQQ